MGSRTDAQLERLADERTGQTLMSLGFDWSPSDRQTAAALRFQRMIPQAPPMIGLVGGASSGKSTLFNSLVGKEVSRISAHAHETLGPVAAVHRQWVDRVKEWFDRKLLFGGAEGIHVNGQAITAGQIGRVHVYGHDVPTYADVIVVDLPDVTSKMAADEGSVTRELLPWFDGLVVVVDEERWFDAAVFDETLAFSRNLGPTIWVVFNRTERSDELTAAQRVALADHAAARRAADHCVSPFQLGSGYRPISVETRRRLGTWVSACGRRDRTRELETHLRRRCSDLLREMVDRNRRLTALRKNVEAQIDALTQETHLSTDLLTADERRLLGLGHRYLPLYDVIQSIRRRVDRFRGRAAVEAGVDFDKGVDRLASVLRRNLEHRFRHATDTIERIVLDSPYRSGCQDSFRPRWSLPSFDEREWAVRIRSHIDAWKTEARQQARRGDVGALAVGMPLLLADLLFLGGAGMSLAWTTAWIAGFVGAKGVVRMFDRSPALAAYQTTVAAYQAIVRESLTEQAATNLEALPRRHVSMTDPIAEAILCWSTPTTR